MTGKETKFGFNAFAFRTEDDDVVTLFFKEEQYDSKNVYGIIRSDDIADEKFVSFETKEDNLLFKGMVRRQAGLGFKIYFDQEPITRNGRKTDKPYYMLDDVSIVGFNARES